MTRRIEIEITDALFPIPYLQKKKSYPTPPSMQAFFDSKPGVINNVVSVLAGETPVWHTPEGKIQFNQPGIFYKEVAQIEKTFEGKLTYQILTNRPAINRNATNHTNREPKPELLIISAYLGLSGANEALQFLIEDPETFVKAARATGVDIGKEDNTLKDSTLTTARSWFVGGISPLAKIGNAPVVREVVNTQSGGPIDCINCDGKVSLQVSPELYSRILEGVGYTSIGRGGIAKVCRN